MLCMSAVVEQSMTEQMASETPGIYLSQYQLLTHERNLGMEEC